MAKTLYETIYDAIKQDIVSGKYKDNDMLPSEKELTQTFFTSRITVQRAMNMLTKDGLIKRTPGYGTTVCHAQDTQQPAKTIGLILSNISTDFGVNMLNAIEDYCTANGINLLFKNSKDSVEAEAAAIKSIVSAGAEGIIIQPIHTVYHNQALVKLTLDQFPVVFIDRPLVGLSAPCVSSNNIAAASDAVKYMFQLGHEHIGIITYPPERATTLHDRIKGFKAAYFDCAKPCSQDNILTLDLLDELSGDALEQHNVDKVAAYIQSHPSVTAFLCCELHCTKVAYSACARIDKSIPRDISIMTFDYSPAMPGFETTHILQNEYDIGTKASQLLSAIIAGHASLERIYIPHKIVASNSTKNRIPN